MKLNKKKQIKKLLNLNKNKNFVNISINYFYDPKFLKSKMKSI